jgi:hypothetical protein
VVAKDTGKSLEILFFEEEGNSTSRERGKRFVGGGEDS